MTTYSDISITWHGDVTSISGYAQHARALLKPLIKKGAKVRIEPIKSNIPQVNDQQWISLMTSCINSPPGIVKINHCSPAQGTPNPSGGPNILFTHWETTKIPESWLSSINQYSELWTTNAEALKFKEGLNIPSRVVRYPIDESYYDRDFKSLEIVGIKDNTIVIGSTGMWNNRKNMSDLIIAYCTAFSEKDNINLVIKVNTNNYTNANEKTRVAELIKQIKANINKPGMPAITLVQDILSEEAMDSLISRFNIFASTSRGESKNITMAKAMAMGKSCVFIPVLANLELLESTSLRGNRLLYTVDYVSEPVIQMGNVFSPADSWTRPDTAAFAQQLKNAYLDIISKDLNRDRQKVADGLSSDYRLDTIVETLVNNIRDSSDIKLECV